MSRAEHLPPVPRFEFFEIVKVTTADPQKLVINGQIGAVLGRSLDDDGRLWGYAVLIESEGRCWSLEENELESTGRYGRREDYYSGATIRVQVDEKGRGRVVPEEERG